MSFYPNGPLISNIDHLSVVVTVFVSEVVGSVLRILYDLFFL